MLIIALVLAVIGLAALVTAVVTGNALIAWVCIVASVAGVVLLIVDAVRERSRTSAKRAGVTAAVAPRDSVDEPTEQFDADYPDEAEPEPELEREPVADEPEPVDEADHPEEPTTR